MSNSRLLEAFHSFQTARSSMMSPVRETTAWPGRPRVAHSNFGSIIGPRENSPRHPLGVLRARLLRHDHFLDDEQDAGGDRNRHESSREPSERASREGGDEHD